MLRQVRTAMLSILLGALGIGCGAPEFAEDELDGLDRETFQNGAFGLSIKLPLHEEDGITIRETPSFANAPTTRFACDEPFPLAEVVQIECSREGASLEILYKGRAQTALVIYRPKGRAADYRTFANCTTKSKRRPLPTSLKCEPATLTHGGGGGLASPIDSTIPGATIPNTHWVGSSGKVMRGMAPRNEADYDSLEHAGIASVLIFKRPTGQEVNVETKALRDHGLLASSLLNVPFAWKDFVDFKTPCEQTLEGIRFIQDKVAAGSKVFFHCTVGEDRTGYLAGLLRLLAGEQDLRAIFHGELCERGYSSGNPFKPAKVFTEVDADLTPVFLKMAYKIQKGQITSALDAATCAIDPGQDPGFTGDPELAAASYRCGTSTLFHP
jgi:hypothetical protein